MGSHIFKLLLRVSWCDNPELAVGTVARVGVNEDSVPGGGLLNPTWPMEMKSCQHLGVWGQGRAVHSCNKEEQSMGNGLGRGVLRTQESP